MENKGIQGLISIALASVIAIAILKLTTGLWPIAAIRVSMEYITIIAGVFLGGFIFAGIFLLAVISLTTFSWIIEKVLEKLLVTTQKTN